MYVWSLSRLIKLRDFPSDRGKGAIFWYKEPFPIICEFRLRGRSAGSPKLQDQG